MDKINFKIYRIFFFKKFCNKNEKYKIVKSNRVKNRSYYFVNPYKPKIRISNHYLHPKQEKHKMIDVVLIDTESSTINKKPIYFNPNLRLRDFKQVCYEYIVLENNLYKLSKRK